MLSGRRPLSEFVPRLLAGCLALSLAAVWFWTGPAGLFGILMADPVSGFSYAGIFVLYLCSGPSRYEIAVVLLAGLAVRIAAGRWSTPLNVFPLASFVHMAASAGFVAVAALIVRSGLGSRRRQSFEMLLRVLIFVVLGIAIGQIVEAASRLRPLKLDSYLYAVEQGYGFLASFAAGRLFGAFPWLLQSELFVYYSLPLFLAALYAAHLRRPGATDILFLLYANALLGFTLYMVYPACGPIYAFGDAFPLHPPEGVPLAPAALNCRPNAMPSLHYAGALLLWWNVRSSAARALSLVYVLLTALATLGFGEHYVVDLVVGSAHALFMQALATESRSRTLVAATAAAVMFAWFAVLRYAVPALASSRLLLWTISAGTVAGAEAGRRWLQPEPLGSSSRE
jgi:hypothetical protein